MYGSITYIFVRTGYEKITWFPYPIASMYVIFTYIYHKNQQNVGKYTSIVWVLRKLQILMCMTFLISVKLLHLLVICPPKIRARQHQT